MLGPDSGRKGSFRIGDLKAPSHLRGGERGVEME